MAGTTRGSTLDEAFEIHTESRGTEMRLDNEQPVVPDSMDYINNLFAERVKQVSIYLQHAKCEGP